MKRILLLLGLFWIVPGARAQSLSGVAGLVTIPTAEIAPDATLTMGLNLLNRDALSYHHSRDHARSPYLSLSYLPFLEIGLRLTRAQSGIEEALGDRTAILRVRVLKESGLRPAVLVGVHDFIGSKRHFQATYAVASKRLGSLPGIYGVDLHLGYGTKLIEAELYDFVGPFGGVAVSPVERVRLLGEYVSGSINLGVDAELFRGARLIVGLTGFHALSAGASFAVQLPH